MIYDHIATVGAFPRVAGSDIAADDIKPATGYNVTRDVSYSLPTPWPWRPTISSVVATSTDQCGITAVQDVLIRCRNAWHWPCRFVSDAAISDRKPNLPSQAIDSRMLRGGSLRCFRRLARS